VREYVVDGQSWEVVRRDDGQYDFRWMSGLAQGYGFSSRLSDLRAVLSVHEIEEVIRDFMGSVNPETGYLD
jgi:hypothetical protein